MAKEKKDLRKEIRELNYMEFTRLKLLDELYERGGEILDREDEVLAEMNQKIDKKATDFATLLAMKYFEVSIERLKERKEVLNGEIKIVENLKNFVKYRIHKFVETNGTFDIDIDGITKYVKADYSKSKHIDIEKVSKDLGTYTLKLKAHDYMILKKAVEDGTIAININDFEWKVIQRDLEPDDPAITTELKPMLKFVKTPPK